MTDKNKNRLSISMRGTVDFDRIVHLSELMGCSVSAVGSLAIEQWLHENYRKYKEEYSHKT